MAFPRTLFRILRHFTNWPTVLIDSLGLVADPTVTYSLRTGTKFNFHSNVGSIGLLNEIVFDHGYDMLLNRVPVGGIVVDIGAHVGIFSILVTKILENVSVYSYEPSSLNYRLLLSNIELNKVSKSIHPFKLALAGYMGESILALSTDTVSNSLYRRESDGTQETVKCVTLDDIVNNSNLPRIDFLKMDCEGAELEILKSVTAQSFNKIKNITLEGEISAYHDLRAILEHHGFETEMRLADAKRSLMYLYAWKATDRTNVLVS